MVSTSGSQLLPQEAVKVLRTKLLPLATVVTPNIPEAKLLLKDSGVDVQDPADLEGMVELAKKILQLGPKAVLLKGGHLPLTKDRKTARSPEEASIVIDVLVDGDKVAYFETDFLISRNTHGTGCSLASAVAANLASGDGIVRAVRGAVRFVEAGIKTSVSLGKGSGPINHFHSVYSLPFAPYVHSSPRFTFIIFHAPLILGFSGRFIEYLLDRPDVKGPWKEFTEHEFVVGLGSGTLPIERFKQYLIQDYLYLVIVSLQCRFRLFRC